MTAPGDAEAVAVRLKRLRLRAWRRGTREMDLILGRFADDRLPELTAAALDTFEALLEENDQDLYAWVTGQAAPPERLAGPVADLAAHARSRLGPAAAPISDVV